MKHLTQWILALVVLATAAGLSAALTTFQKEPEKKGRELGQPSQGKKPGIRERAARYEAIRKVMPTLQVTLAESILLAEKESGGKAFEADIEIVADKPLIQVKLFVDGKVTSTTVDPFTKKVTLPRKAEGGEEASEEEGASEGEGGG